MTDEVKSAHKKESFFPNIWVANGRPRGMHFKSYKIYKRAKAEFRHCQNVAYEQYMQSCFEDVNETAKMTFDYFGS